MWGRLQGLTTGNMTVMKKGGGVFNNQCSNLDKLSAYLQCPSCSPQKWLCLSDEGIQWGRSLPDMDPQIKNLATSPEACSMPLFPRQGS